MDGICKRWSNNPSLKRPDIPVAPEQNAGSGWSFAAMHRTGDGSEVARVEHGRDVWSVAFSPDGGLLATGSSDGTARLIRIEDGRVDHWEYVTSVTFSPAGDLLATGTYR